MISLRWRCSSRLSSSHREKKSGWWRT